MVTKSASGKKTTKAGAAAGLMDSSKKAILQSMQSAPAALKIIDPDTRRRLVAAEAYFRAERRGFAAGGELEDWITAEKVVDSRLEEMQHLM
jgi:hypothetical protein